VPTDLLSGACENGLEPENRVCDGSSRAGCLPAATSLKSGFFVRSELPRPEGAVEPNMPVEFGVASEAEGSVVVGVKPVPNMLPVAEVDGVAPPKRAGAEAEGLELPRSDGVLTVEVDRPLPNKSPPDGAGVAESSVGFVTGDPKRGFVDAAGVEVEADADDPIEASGGFGANMLPRAVLPGVTDPKAKAGFVGAAGAKLDHGFCFGVSGLAGVASGDVCMSSGE
jgi:hypothetical protein